MDQLAFHLFADRILNYIGSYHLKLGGNVDAIVFSGGIGERSKDLRKYIADKVQCLGYLSIDDAKNEGVDSEPGAVVDISSTESAATTKKLLVCRTDEQVRHFHIHLNCR